MDNTGKGKPARTWARGGRRLALAALSVALLAGCGQSPEEMLASAKSYLAKRDLNAASIQLKNALQENADLAEARFLLGTVNLDQGDIAGAVKELERALALGYPATEVKPLLARALVRSAQFDRVIAEFAELRLDDPAAQGAVLTAVADAYLGKANVAESLKAYQAALDANPGEPHAGVGLSRAQLFNGDAVAAEASIRSVLERAPDLPDAHALLADVMLASGRGDESLKSLEEAVRLAPAAVGYHYGLVSQLLQRGDTAAADTRLADLKKLAPSHPSTVYLQSFVDFRAGKLTEARDGVLQVLKQAPDFLPAQLLAGSVLLRLGDNIQARTHLNAVLSRLPSHDLARSLLVMSHLGAGESERALELLQPLLDRPSDDPRLLGLAGQVYLANGDFDKAEGFLKRATQAAPEDPQARMRLGVARMAGGDAEGAFAELQTAAQMDEGGIAADLALVTGHMRRGELDKALEAQLQLERKQPDSPMVANLRGGLMMARNALPDARAAFERALVLKPDYLAAAINLARIDLNEKKSDDALARIRGVIAANPKSVEAHLALAELQVTTRAAPAEVLATLERAEAIERGALVPTLAIVQHHLRTREVAKALAGAQKAAAAYPNDARAADALARAQLASGDTQQAISSLNRVASLRPQATAPLLQLADVHRTAGDLNAAEQSLRKALGVRPDAVDVQQRLAALLLERGERDAALRVARNVQKQHPQAPSGYVLEAEIQSNAGNWKEAASNYRRALERQAGGEVVSRLHAVLLRDKRQQEADKLASDWLKSQPRDVAVRGYLAERALVERRYADAQLLFAAINELSPNNPLVLNNLAWAAGQAKDPMALQYAQQAVALAPDNAAILDTLGVIQVEQGLADEGLANLARAVSLSPEVMPLRLNYAKSLARAGRSADARAALEALIPQLNEGTPLHREASELLKTL